MDEPGLRGELEGVYEAVRRGFATYDLESVRPLLSLPEGAALPSREEAHALAAYLPAMADCRFLAVRSEGDRAAWYAESDLASADTVEATVVRFVRSGGSWRLAPAPHTLYSYSIEAGSGRTAEDLVEDEAALAPFPDAEDEDAPAAAPPAEASPGDPRPDAEVLADVVARWQALHAALAAGDAGAANLELDPRAGYSIGGPEEARDLAGEFPDPARFRPIRLGWVRGKPDLTGLYAAGPGEVALMVFARHGGVWRFAPGPGSLERVPVEDDTPETVLRVIEEDHRLRL